MNLIASDATLWLAGKPDPASSADILSFAVGDCAFGKVLVARSTDGVCAILLGGSAEELESGLAARFPGATLVANEAMVRDDLAKVARYTENLSEGLELCLDMRGTRLQRRIWQQIRAIPAGKTVDCMQVARWINCAYPRVAARAVANACAANPIALAVPCHRVMRSDGELAGYRCGIERTLLEKEAMASGRTPPVSPSA